MVYNGTKNSSGFQGNIESGFSPELGGDIPGNIVLGIQGPPGGFYTPSVSQPDASTMRIRHTASKSDMPGVNATDITLPPGPKGDPFTFADFTPEQLEFLRGPKGNAFTYEDFTPEQLEALRGEPGVPGKDGTVSFDELTEAQRESLKGDPFRYEDFTAEQLAALKGEPGYTPQKNIDYFDGQPGYTPRKGIDYFDGNPGYTPQKGIDYFDGKDGRTPQIELLNVVEDSTSGDTRYGVTIKANNFKDDGTESFMIATVWDGKDGQPGKDGQDYVLTPADKTEIAEMAAELVEVPEGSGGGIAVTGAKVGQTVKISAVDENGVPTAWLPTDFPSGGSGGNGNGVLELIVDHTVTAEEAKAATITFTKDAYPLIDGQKLLFLRVIKPTAKDAWWSLKAGSTDVINENGDNYVIQCGVASVTNGVWLQGTSSDGNFAGSSKMALQFVAYHKLYTESRTKPYKYYDELSLSSYIAVWPEGTTVEIYGGRFE